MTIFLNLFIFLCTLGVCISYFRSEGKWDRAAGIRSFRFFTTLSNVLCAVSALLVAISALSGNIPGWVTVLKYTGTCAVTVTFLTVMFFLGPSFGYKALLGGTGFYMHLLGPLLAIFTFCFLECKTRISFGFSLIGLIPTALYAAVYLYKVVICPESRRWEDFYGFNRGGKWPLSIAAMMLGTFVICIVLRVLTGI